MSQSHEASPRGTPERRLPVAPETLGFASATVSTCTRAVEAYRKQEKSKTEALRDISSALKLYGPYESDHERENREAAFYTYLSYLDEVDRDLFGARVRGRTPEGDHGNISQTQAAFSPRAGTHSGRATSPGELGKRHRRRGNEREDSDSDEESFRRAVNDNLLPFVNPNWRDFVNSDSDTGVTLILKENYLRDISYVKHRIVCHPRCPPAPDGVWNDIIANRFVDLDKIFTAIHSTSGDKGERYEVGELEITTKSSKTNKRIVEHGDWTVPWALYEEAVSFLYPHRALELRGYFNHITGTFSSLRGPDKGRVISYDRAIRSHVARYNSRLLTDFGEFNSLYTAHIHSAGVGAASGSSAAEGRSKRLRKSKREPCIRWNRGECTNNNDCRYRHVCSSCGSREHSARKCSSSA